MPTFFIIGAQKCGTTALYHFLNQHPDVFMSPVKEPNFFAFDGEPVDFRDADGRYSPIRDNSITDLPSYQALFSGRTRERAVGEASPHYLYVSGTAKRIKDHIPDVKLIAILRDPVERAYSAYLHARLASREPVRDFEEALRREDDRIRSRHGYIYHYASMGFYYRQLLEYFDQFKRDQIKIYIHDDLEDDSLGFMRDIYSFIGVDSSFVPDMSLRHNASGIPRSASLHKLLRYVSTRKGIYKYVPEFVRSVLPTSTIHSMAMKVRGTNLHKPPIPPDGRAYLVEMYREEVARLERLIDRDLSHWIT